MTYSEVLQAARGCSGPYCKACPVCNGRACGSSMPGPGAKGTGTVAVRNYEAWQSIRLDLDTICENKPVDTRYTFFGQQYDLPVFAGPVGATKLHYGEKYDDQAYNSILVPACAQAGIAAFTGDGTDPAVFTAAARAIGASGGKGIPTVKPWDRNTLFSKLDEAKAAGAQVIAMDIDAAGLPFLKGLQPPAGSKTVAELREIVEYAEVPFLIKGVMTVKGARKALEAGAADFEADGSIFEITCDPDDFNAVTAALEGKGYAFAEAAIEMVPQNYIKLTGEDDIKNMTKLIDLLEDNDDVQNVWHNWEQE